MAGFCVNSQTQIVEFKESGFFCKCRNQQQIAVLKNGERNRTIVNTATC